MDLSALKPSQPEPRAKGQLREGVAYAARTTDIAVPLLMMGLVGMLAYEFQVSLPVFAKDTFHGGSEAYGFMTASMGLGAVAGGLLTAARGRTGTRPMVISAAGFGLAILFTALAPTLWLSYLGLLFVGWASVSFISIGNSTIQLSSAPNMRGRALSLWQLAFQGTTPVGGPLIGWVIEESEPRVGLVIGALSCLVAAASGTLLSRHRLGPGHLEKRGSPGTDVAGQKGRLSTEAQ
jgi:MFS family permease